MGRLRGTIGDGARSGGCEKGSDCELKMKILDVDEKENKRKWFVQSRAAGRLICGANRLMPGKFSS